ncbi:putative coiled-coil domain-containing protein 196 isoform X2 [Notamacropus eugenii]|uniref:putative coiled-coil domain-containing protein 196 isoform X2 n=1 Tax=Notamacropus eugenii TaxID=9315 RepID=UPI003B6794A3
MTSGTNSSTSYLKSRIRNPRTQDSYLRELNEDLKTRKRELLEMLKPLEEKNGTLLQNLMINLEEKQKSLQIMRQIMAGKGGDSDDTIVLEMIEEAEELKQNLEKKNKLLRREMELLSNKQAIEDDYRMQQKAMLLKGKAEMQALKERLQRNKEQVTFQEETDDIQELHSKVIEEKIEALSKPQKANDLQLFHYLKQNLEIPQVSSKLLISPRYSKLSCTGQKSTCECGLFLIFFLHGKPKECQEC